MATKWVSLDKLRYAISKIHTLLQGKVDKVDGKGLSANDLTAALKGNYDAAYTHSQAAHAPADAEKNIIVGVQVNGSDLTPDGSRKVNVRVPTGALAGKSQVSETDLDDALKEKVNSASEGNHSHNNKAVLDQIEQADLDKLDGIAAGANKYTLPTSSGSKHIPTGGASGQILRWSADGTAVWGADNDTKYTDMTGASASAAGKAGLVPAPAAGGQAKYLRGDGTWQTPPDTKYSPATQSTNGLMSAADKTKLDGVAAGANKYVHPTSSGSKHIPTGGASGQILRWSADGTAVWGADNDTKYSPVTQSANGLMSAVDKKKLDGFGAASSYALKSDITQMYRYKGSVSDASKLPASGQVAGDVYDIQAASSYGPAGTNVAWNGTAWDALGGAFTIEECTNAEIDQIFTDLAAG